jgi:hypothetical protein
MKTKKKNIKVKATQISAFNISFCIFDNRKNLKFFEKIFFSVTDFCEKKKTFILFLDRKVGLFSRNQIFNPIK